MPSVSFDNLLECLEMRETTPGTYTGANLALEYHRIFGGQILAQTITAATAASGPREGTQGKQVKSLVQLFPREGNSELAMNYAVTKHQEGRTFGSTGIVASQTDSEGRAKPVSVATLSLHTPEEGFVRQDDAPAVGKPEDAALTDLGMIPWETRVVDGVDLSDRAAAPASYRFWMRTPSVPDSPALHQALLAHATDLTVIGTALRPTEGLSQADTMTKFHSAVTSHSLWFHQPFRVDEWLLVDQCSPILAGGRAYGRGDVWSLDGRLVASFAQESMIRMLPTG